MLPSEFLCDWNVQRSLPLEHFRSKKNDVQRIQLRIEDGTERTVVAKRFRSLDACQRERGFLGALHRRGAPVPLMHWCAGRWIIMQYVRGPLLLDVLTADGAESHLWVLGEALARIYAGLAGIQRDLILGDMNLRNFIVCRSAGEIYRVDLESVTRGHKEEDVGRICAFYLTYDPPFTECKMRLGRLMFRSLVQKLRLRDGMTRAAALMELTAMEDRRGIEVPEEIRRVVRSW